MGLTEKATDEIQLPPKARFASVEEYYATRFHEMGHSTGAKHRLDRKLEGDFGDKDYSREELIAEMTSAFLCAHCGIDNSVIENSAAYLQGWINILKGDSKLVVIAASQAQKAANLILGIGEGES
jgi:antirestriction protein ArdC